jgi:hypothetical protein
VFLQRGEAPVKRARDKSVLKLVLFYHAHQKFVLFLVHSLFNVA